VPRPTCNDFINYASYSGQEGFFMTDSIATGFIKFNKVDSVSAIFSGEFSFTARNEQRNIKINNGIFDYHQE